MKIVFICGSLEPGHDGVGDYTRRFASELMRLKHYVAIISINDPHIDKLFSGTQNLEGITIPVYRIPSSIPEIKRFYYLQTYIDRFNPEWISLQFVPFAFNDKGLSFTLSNLLVKIGKGRRWHIMFHELWVGMNKESSVKYFWWGWLQKRLIVSLIKKIKPSIIHTQTGLYMSELQKLGFNPRYLPLFSNIPVRHMRSEMSNISSESGFSKRITFVLFAAIHAGAPAQKFAKEIAAISKQTGIQFLLIIIGRCGIEQNKWASAWQAEGLLLEVRGEQSPERVSEVFSNASIGLTTTPFVLAEKSGAVAAMLEHNLPVICVSYPWTPRKITGLQLPEGIIEYADWNIDIFTSGKQLVPARNQISELSRNFADALLRQ
jgi:peptidoglycan hydrolase-like protein with peptidoglycan-binding domain